MTRSIRYFKADIDDFYAQNPNVSHIALKGFRGWLSLYARAHGYKMTDSHSDSDSFF